jgi:iron complex outermembrane recepter protein
VPSGAAGQLRPKGEVMNNSDNGVFSKLLVGSMALVGLMLSAAPAYAQDTGGIEEVVVTARHRSEDIEKLPAQDTAFTADAIAAKGITAPADYLDAVPNVTFIATQNAGTSFIVMRGISQARNSEPSAAIVVDGVPMTQPAEFNQELLDIQQIEVLKGPQGALYGRDAIGGAILVTTKQPTDEWEEELTAGYDNGPGGKVQGVVSGPITDDLKIRAAASYLNTDGTLRNIDTADPSSKRDADPVEDFNARVSFLYTPTSNFTADLRLSTDLLNTRGLYYVVSPTFTNNPNFTSQPINLNNSGEDDRKIYDAALKLTYNTEPGTFTSISGYSTVWEILTGDGYPFDPYGHSKIDFDYSQSQFLTAKTFSQELRFTSPTEQRFRYIIGAEIFDTTRFISTDTEYDIGDMGVQPIYYVPNPQAYQPFGQISFLADGQHQFAWAGYVDTSTDITKALELSLNMRYDSDHRTNTTDTPQAFLNTYSIPATTGEQRSQTWSAFQPQAILKYQWTDDLSVYADYSRGFRSGGFNQTGVAQAAAAVNLYNVGDQFGAEIAGTYEAGFKSRWLNDHLIVNGSVYQTMDHNDYYFVYLASNSTQNLGNIPEVRFRGFDLDATARLDENWSANGGFGLTDSNIRSFPEPSLAPPVVGSKAPLVSDYTFNAGIQYDHPIWSGWSFEGRLDDNLIGPTTFVIPVITEPHPIQRDPVNLVDLRASLISDGGWQVTAWSKNLFNKIYNAEYSTGGFLFPAERRTWGLNLTKHF